MRRDTIHSLDAGADAGPGIGAPSVSSVPSRGLNAFVSQIEAFSDIHLCVGDLGRSNVFYAEGRGPLGPQRIQGEHLELAQTLLKMCQASGKVDFMIEVGSTILRGRLDDMPVDSNWFKLRVTDPERPSLDTLPTPLQPWIRNLLLSPALCRGGLVYIVGSPGAGKTTTGSGAIASRLCEFGGVATTLENPPEKTLNGWHGRGFCYQGALSGDTEEHWERAFRNVLRSQPAGALLMLYVGEVRDGESARAMLQASTQGFLVVATGFGREPVSGLMGLVGKAKRASDDDQVIWDLLATTLRLVIHQELQSGVLRARALASYGPESSVASRIRTGQFAQLANDLQFQSNQAMLKKDENFDMFEMLRRHAASQRT